MEGIEKTNKNLLIPFVCASAATLVALTIELILFFSLGRNFKLLFTGKALWLSIIVIAIMLLTWVAIAVVHENSNATAIVTGASIAASVLVAIVFHFFVGAFKDAANMAKVDPAYLEDKPDKFCEYYKNHQTGDKAYFGLVTSPGFNSEKAISIAEHFKDATEDQKKSLKEMMEKKPTDEQYKIVDNIIKKFTKEKDDKEMIKREGNTIYFTGDDVAKLEKFVKKLSSTEVKFEKNSDGKFDPVFMYLSITNGEVMKKVVGKPSDGGFSGTPSSDDKAKSASSDDKAKSASSDDKAKSASSDEKK